MTEEHAESAEIVTDHERATGENETTSASAIWRRTKGLARKSAKAAERAYDKTKVAVTQEEAWSEVSISVDQLVDIARAQHAMILDLPDRVEVLEQSASRSED